MTKFKETYTDLSFENTPC